MSKNKLKLAGFTLTTLSATPAFAQSAAEGGSSGVGAAAAIGAGIAIGLAVVMAKQLVHRWTDVPFIHHEPYRYTVVTTEHDIAQYVPDPPEGLLGFDRSVELALQRVRDADVSTRWSTASLPGAPSDPLPTDPDWAGGSLYEDRRSREVDASSASLWRVIEGIGGDHGWYSFPLAWRVRGILDRFVGGVGLRRGRRDPAEVRRI